MRLVRLKLDDRSDVWDSLYVDLFVDEFGSANDGLITYGRWGQLSEEPWPFTLRPKRGTVDAKVDFGTGVGLDVPLSADDRFGTTNLLSKRIVVGELATFNYSGDEICYQIVEAKVMPEGEDFRPHSFGGHDGAMDHSRKLPS